MEKSGRDTELCEVRIPVEIKMIEDDVLRDLLRMIRWALLDADDFPLTTYQMDMLRHSDDSTVLCMMLADMGFIDVSPGLVITMSEEQLKLKYEDGREMEEGKR